MLHPVLREEERVTALELFFDLVFVLAITQCTALMAREPTWAGLARGLLVLAVLWWAWAGVLVADERRQPGGGRRSPLDLRRDGGARSSRRSACRRCSRDRLCCSRARTRSCGSGTSCCSPSPAEATRRSCARSSTLAGSTAVGVGLIALAAAFDGWAQGALWVAAVVLDFGGPFFFGSEGWRLEPRHFAERHELIIIIALGESIVAIGVGAGHVVDAGVVVAAVLGMAVAASFWWLYFDVVALVAARRLAEAPRGKVQNEMARDSYSYLHYLMVAGIVLVALGLKKTLGRRRP